MFRFRDYRTFLRAFYDHNKQREYGFSLRAFSKRAQLRSSNYLKLVMDGDRNLTADGRAPRPGVVQGRHFADCTTTPPRPEPGGGMGSPGCRGATFVELESLSPSE